MQSAQTCKQGQPPNQMQERIGRFTPPPPSFSVAVQKSSEQNHSSAALLVFKKAKPQPNTHTRKLEMWWKRAHACLGAIFLIPAILTALTGVTYRFARNVLQVEKDQVKWLMRLHQGEFLEGFSVVYTAFNAMGMLFLILSGWRMMRQRFWRADFKWERPKTWRALHQQCSSLVLFFLLVTPLTGASYRFLRNVCKAEKEHVRWLMAIHEGNYFTNSSVIYTALTAACLLVMATSGATMLPSSWVFRALLGRTSPSKKSILEPS